jgi:thioredoxin 1
MGFIFLLAPSTIAAAEKQETLAARGGGRTVAEVYGDLATGPLRGAYLEDLPPKVLLRSEGIEITLQDLEREISRAQPELQGQLRKYGLFLLEQMLIPKLLVEEARVTLGKDKRHLSWREERELVRELFRRLGEKVSVSEQEVQSFYQSNREALGGASLEEVRSALEEYLRQDKEQQAIAHYVRNLGRDRRIVVNGKWVEKQSHLCRDNPVDRARSSGIPTLVDFGASGCVPCDMMTPILESLRQKYQGKLNVLFVHVGQEQILGARYGVQGIPHQILFDREGKEVFRHTGFLAQSEIEKKLSEIGVD